MCEEDLQILINVAMVVTLHWLCQYNSETYLAHVCWQSILARLRRLTGVWAFPHLVIVTRTEATKRGPFWLGPLAKLNIIQERICCKTRFLWHLTRMNDIKVRIRQEKSIRKFPSWKCEGNFSFEKWKHCLRKTKWRSFHGEFRKFSEEIVAIFFISHIFFVQNYNNSQQNTPYLTL
jgi:hypothetical protein